MKRRKLTKALAALLSACMVLGNVPAAGTASEVFAADQTVDFTNADSRGNWKLVSGNGSVSFTDGEGDAGFMTIRSDGNTVIADDSTEALLDGYMEMDVEFAEAEQGARLVFVFRYNGPEDWEGVGVDQGSWLWFTGAGGYGNLSSTKDTFKNVGESHHMRIEYRGDNVIVLADGEEIINQDVAEFGSVSEGHIGFRLWGELQGTYDGRVAFHIDNVKTGPVEPTEEKPEPEPEPDIPEEMLSYTRDFREGIDGFEKVSGSGKMEAVEEGVAISGNGIFVDQNSNSLKNQEVEFTYDPMNNSCNYGVVLRYSSPSSYFYVGPSSQHSQHYTKWGVYGPNGQLVNIEDSGFVLEGRVMPYKVKVRAVGKTVTIFVDNEEIWNGEVDVVTTAGKAGFCTTSNTGMTIQGLTQETAVSYEAAADVTTKTIRSSEMTVAMDSEFPRVESYTLASKETLKGQEIPLHVVEINNKVYTPAVTADIAGDTARYHLSVEELDLAFDVVFTVEGHVLTMKVEEVEEGDTLLYTLNFPRHSLISMADTEPNAELRVNNYQGETRKKLSALSASEAYSETTLAVLSSSKVAAAVSGESYKNRHEIAYQTFDAGDYNSTGIWVNEYTYRGLDGEKMLDPWARVSVTTDRNDDGKVDYQDGAIALRDDCMAEKVGSELMADSWNMIAMNVGSEAQYPFLRILDNAKKVSLATDNFGQNIFIKGYQSEGHDSSHPDFANYNKRAGGLEDFNTLLANSESSNTTIGVHVNQTDTYPEAPQYSKLKTSLSAWSWYDSSAQIIRENDGLDKSEDGMDARFAKLFDEDTENMLDSVYVDVFFGTRWPMYKLVENINGSDRAMALGTEYVDEFVSYSVFAHHIGSDFGGAGNLVRIVDHNRADIFANHRLFRGANSRNNDDAGINGWQTAKDLDNALQAFYERILPNKFLAQYPVMQYENDNKAVLGYDNEVVTEMKDGVNVISLDGRDVARGNQIFIPWETEEEAEGKIYHWNTSGGTTTWELPKSWENVSTVTIYELSDEGKKEAVGILSKNGSEVTIEAEAKTGYVIYKDEVEDIETADTVEWSTGSPVKDMGFDSKNFDEWKPSSEAGTTEHITIENNSLGNSHLYITGEKDGAVSQTLTGLVPGQTYAASVWCITDDGREAAITVENGSETVSTYMDRSNVTYGVHHNDKYQTKAQRMQVRFTAESETALLTLSGAAGASADSVVDFDDVRVAKVGADTNPDPTVYTYWEDFENVDQGWGVFTSTESDQSHLSQKNPVNPEETPDVISGMYSLKVRAGDYMRTLPSGVRFEPETEYTVGISYKSPSANAFTFAVKSDRAEEAGDTAAAVLASAAAEDTEGTLELKFTTGDYTDYYVDITKKAAGEYYVDNFYVKAARPINRTTLGELVEEAKALEESAYTPESYQVLEEAVKEAEAVLGNDQADQEEIRSAYKAVEAAAEALVAYADAEEKAALQEAIDTMKLLAASDYKQDAQWNVFRAKIKEAEKLHEDTRATSPEVTQMIRDLREAKDGLNPIVDRTAYKEIMAKAERVERSAIVDGVALQTFLSAMEEAKNADLKAGVSEEELAAAVEALTEAYKEIVLKDEAKSKLVLEALSLTKVNEAYFLAEDLAVINEAKAALNGMDSRTGVKAADFYDALIMLEEALEKELSSPAIPTSMEIDSADFVIESNNEQPLTGSEGPVELAFDKNEDTWWHCNYSGGISESNPAQITVDLGAVYTLNQMSYLQRAAGGDNGKVQVYNLYVKEAESDEWTAVITGAGFEDDPEVQYAAFEAVTARYVMFEVTQGYGGFAAAAELVFYQAASDFAALQKLMNEAERLDKEDYTEESFAAVEAALANAEPLLENLMTPQEEIDAAAEALAEAMEALELLEPVQTIENPFEDVSEADYFYDAVLWAVESQVTTGRTPTAFGPWEACSRGDIVTFLYRAMNGTKSDAECKFTDVNPADYYYEAMMWAVEEGITQGRTATTFAPYAICSRADIVTFLWRAMGKEMVTTDKSFPDVNPADYFYDAVRWAVEEGVTKGKNNGMFGAFDPCFRGDAVTFIQRAVE